MGDNDHKYLCWLAGIKGIGRKKKFALLRAAGQDSLFSVRPCPGNGILPGGTGGEGNQAPDHDKGGEEPEKSPGAREAFRCAGDGFATAARILYASPEEQLRFLCGEAYVDAARGQKAANLLLNARKQEPERIAEELERAGIVFLSALEKGFPAKLKEIPDPPFGVYCKGSMPAEDEPAAAVIGARFASVYGREQARRFGRRMGAGAIAVISGMARGIDGIAQKAALDAGGKSFAVLGCGVDICYPEENRDLYERLLREGGVLSEYPPGTFPEARLFPPRNRIISGLSDLVLVIEARRKSGTLITVDMALEQGREVYALPGRVSDSLSEGCNRLIRQGAGPATCPEDILEFFFGAAAGGNPGPDVSSVPQRKKRTPLEETVLRILSKEDEMHLERILEALGRPSGYFDEEEEPPEGASPGTVPRDPVPFQVSVKELISVLMHLKTEGKVQEGVTGYFRRAGTSEGI